MVISPNRDEFFLQTHSHATHLFKFIGLVSLEGEKLVLFRESAKKFSDSGEKTFLVLIVQADREKFWSKSFLS